MKGEFHDFGSKEKAQKRRRKLQGHGDKKVQQVLKGNIGCMSVQIKCEGEKMKDYQGN